MVRIVINADDLGKNTAVNAAIAEGIRQKRISSATIMANTEHWDEVLDVVSSSKDISFGVHLNLTEGQSLINSDIFKKYDITDCTGRFTRNIRNIKEWNDEILKSVYEEWDAQINLIKIIKGIPVTHLDGHHHIHSDLVFTEILVELCNKYDIPSIRNKYWSPLHGLRKSVSSSCKLISHFLPFDRTSRTNKPGNKYKQYLKSLIEYHQWHSQIRNQVTPSYFDSYEHALQQCDIYKTCKDGEVLELMCHPGHPNFSKEYSKVMDAEFQKRTGCKMISYNDLICHHT